ncbi:MAG: hypothetical protein FWG83_06820 [Oscillospiraceae bacterium]|nr:hypothetical protein [Oscillospiraceae bacterium]
MTALFKNNLRLTRFILRRDRVSNLIWLGGIISLCIGFAAGIGGMYPDSESLNAMLVTLESPAFKAMVGTPFVGETGELSLGGMYAVYILVWAAIIVGIMNVFLVVRHTRQDEERGRIELIRSLPVGRLSNLSSSITAAVILNLLISLVIGFGLAAVGERDMASVSGGLLFGGIMGAFGIFMAGISAVFCQLCKNPGVAMSLSFGTLTLLYMLFATGSMRDSQIILNISILGLLQHAKPYAGNHYWLPVIATVLASCGLILTAFLLCKSRDMGEGLIPARPGKKDASPRLKSPEQLAWRLLKTPFVVWMCIIPMLGAAYGLIMGDMETLINSNDMFKQISGGDPMRMASFFLLIMAICAGIPVLQFMLKVRTQEKRGYSENLLSRSVSRYAQMRGYFIIAVVSAILMPLMNAVGFWGGSHAVMEEPIRFTNWLLACSVYIPAILVLLGVAAVLNGFLPKFTSWAWWYLGFSFVILYLGQIMNLPQWLGKLSPFGHVPMLPHVEQIGEMQFEIGGVVETIPLFGEATYTFTSGDITALIIMTILSIIMFVLGFMGFRKRDSQS